MGVRTRAARQEDGPALVAIDVAAWDPAGSVAPRAHPEESFFTDGLVPADVLVAEVDGAPAGYLGLRPPTRLATNAHVRQVQGLAVAPARRGAGVGAALLAAADRRCAEHGVRRLTLRVLATNAPARRLYDRAGFVVEGVLRGEFVVDGREVDDVLMARRGGASRPVG